MISAPGSVVFRHYYEVSVLSCESLKFSTNAEGHFAIHINVRDIRASRIPIYTSLGTLRLFFSRMISPLFGAGCTSVLFLARLVEARSCTQGGISARNPRCYTSIPSSISSNHMFFSSHSSCQRFGPCTQGSRSSAFQTCYTPLPVTRFSRTRWTTFISEDKSDALQIFIPCTRLS